MPPGTGQLEPPQDSEKTPHDGTPTGLAADPFEGNENMTPRASRLPSQAPPPPHRCAAAPATDRLSLRGGGHWSLKAGARTCGRGGEGCRDSQQQRGCRSGAHGDAATVQRVHCQGRSEDRRMSQGGYLRAEYYASRSVAGQSHWRRPMMAAQSARLPFPCPLANFPRSTCIDMQSRVGHMQTNRSGWEQRAAACGASSAMAVSS